MSGHDALDDLLEALAELQVSVQQAKAGFGARRPPGDDLAHGINFIEEELTLRVPEVFQAIEEGDLVKLCLAARALVSSAMVFEGYRKNKPHNPAALNRLLASLGRVATARAQLCQPRGVLGRPSLAGSL